MINQYTILLKMDPFRDPNLVEYSSISIGLSDFLIFSISVDVILVVLLRDLTKKYIYLTETGITFL